MPSLQIHDRMIGPGHRPYVIAELGVNHDGSTERAVSLVRLASASGADAVKVQVFRAEMLMSRASRLAEYQVASGETDPVAMLRRLELSWEGFECVLGQAHDLGLAAIATVFSVPLVEGAARLRSRAGRGFDVWKTASPDIIHRPLLEALGDTGRPLIVSTGAATLDEIARAVGWLSDRPAPVHPALLQCVSSYPTPPHLAALEGIPALATAHPGLVIGYSDHTTSEQTGAEAVALGASVLEKHFTDDPRRPGPDHAASLDPAGFRRYVRAAHEAHAVRRPAKDGVVPAKRLLDIERDVREVSRQSVVAARDLAAGWTLGPADIAFKRPGTGLEPFRAGEILGHRLRGAVEADAPLTARDVV